MKQELKIFLNQSDTFDGENTLKIIDNEKNFKLQFEVFFIT
jgi:hypothetical protein